MIYVYYGIEDARTHSREVISVVPEREKYYDEFTPIPNKEELKNRHDQNLASMISGIEKNGKKLTADEKEKLDPWKYPQQKSNQNIQSFPGFGDRKNPGESNQSAPTPPKTSASGAESTTPKDTEVRPTQK